MTELRFPKPARRSVKRKRSKPSRLGLRKECDRRFAVLVKSRDGWQCRACGSPYRIQCAHIVSRRYHATRWSLANAVALCAKDHMRFTCDPLAWDAWVEERIGLAGYNELKRVARAGVARVDYEAVLASLPEVPK